MCNLKRNSYKEEYRRIKMWILLNMLLYVTIECISSLNVIERFVYLAGHFDILLINYIILLIITCPCLLFHKMTFVFNLFVVGILGITYTSRILMSIRGLPLRLPDFFILKEGLSIADKYLSWDLVALLIILLGMGLFLLAKTYSNRLDIYHPKLIVHFVILVTTLNLVVVSKAHIGDGAEIKTSMSYSEEGIIYSFVTSYESSGASIPENYSEATMNALKGKLSQGIIAPLTSQNPNIIFLQIESFIDPLGLKNITYSEDPIPNMRKYMTGNWQGIMQMPDINTARTEFEILTGVRIANLFKYEVPYTSGTLDDRPIESIAHILRKHQNYNTTALHNHEGSFYQRDETYGRLGFEHYIPVEHMEDVEYSKNWPKDKVLFKYITETLETTPNRDFIFAVTVGTHSSYDYNYEENTSGIVIQGEVEDSAKHQVQDYIDRFVETDQFVGELIDYIHQSEEPTILVAYGDHIPALDVLTYDPDYIKDQVPYFIVSNYPLSGKAEPIIPAYKIYTELFNTVGIEGGLIGSAHNVFKESKEYLDLLDLTAYDLLIGNRYLSEGIDNYETVDLKLGPR